MYSYIKDQDKAKQTLEKLYQMPKLGFDTETTGIDPHTESLILLQLGDVNQQFLYDCRYIDPIIFKDLLEGDKPKIGTNLKFDYKFLKKHRVEPDNLYDIFLIEKVLLSGKVSLKAKNVYSLRALANKYLNIDLDKKMQNTFKLYGEITEQQKKYAASDVIYPIQILEKQTSLLKLESLVDTAKLECEVVPSFSDMEYIGFYLNPRAWKDIIEKVNKRIKELKGHLDLYFKEFAQKDCWGNPIINYDSPDQLLFNLKKAGFNIENTSNETLLFLEDKNLSQLLLEYRSVAKARSSYGENYLDLINPKTGRVHPEINQIGAPTGRTSMNRPNLQQQINKEIGQGISGNLFRSAWQARNGALITADFAGQEVRILAEISKEPSWLETFQKDEDLHNKTALDVFNLVVSKKKNPEVRNIFKNLNFGICYGLNEWGLYKLYQQIGRKGTIEDALSDLNRYFSTYPKIKETVEKLRLGTLEDGCARTLGGRKRYFHVPPYKMVWSKRKKCYIPVSLQYGNKQAKKKIHAIMREGSNAVIQGTGADIMKKSMKIMRDKIKKDGISFLHLVNQVHDEVVGEDNKHKSKEECTYIGNKYILQPMLEGESYFLKEVPPAVEMEISKEWVK